MNDNVLRPPVHPAPRMHEVTTGPLYDFLAGRIEAISFTDPLMPMLVGTAGRIKAMDDESLGQLRGALPTESDSSLEEMAGGIIAALIDAEMASRRGGAA